MSPPNIPAAKRAGLPVDFERLRLEGDAYLTPEDRYALKTHGVCMQLQPGVFMVRVRVPGGVLLAPQAHGLARLARQYGSDWLHLTTRQDVELHWVEARHVADLLDDLASIGLSSRSSCGHTLRNVMSSEDAGTSLDEPFDCFPDARLVSDTLLARSAELNCELPGRINVAFGGSPRCRQDARVNDAGFVSTVVDGRPGYELWAGGSLGKSPALAVKLADFVPRRDVVAAAEALVDVYLAHGDLDTPSKGRMKFVVDAMGTAAFRAAWDQAFAAACARPHAEAEPVDVLADVDRVAILQQRPPGGWSTGVRPQCQPGLAMLTIDVPLGDTNSSELTLYADLADRYADGAVTLTRDQNVSLRNVDIAAVASVRRALQPRRLFFLGEGHQAAVRACTGSSVCSLGITTAPEAGQSLLETASLGRNSGLRVHISGCPNSCAQHQIGDIGLSGAKVRIHGKTVAGYHVYLGADLAIGELGRAVGRVAATDVSDAVDAVVGTWEALRHDGEGLAATVRRIGFDAFGAQIAAELPDRWEPGEGDEADLDVMPAPTGG
jgi:sulfite reductase beta subunit-like hemoprotein